MVWGTEAQLCKVSNPALSAATATMPRINSTKPHMLSAAEKKTQKSVEKPKRVLQTFVVGIFGRQPFNHAGAKIVTMFTQLRSWSISVRNK